MIQPGTMEVFGTVGILSVGAGDTKLSFDPVNPQDRIRAARIVTDMLRRGYALLVEVERDGKKVFERVTEFRENTCEYIVADFDPLVAATTDSEENHEPEASSEAGAQSPQGHPPRGRRPRKMAVPAEKTRAVAVARSAGG